VVGESDGKEWDGREDVKRLSGRVHEGLIERSNT